MNSGEQAGRLLVVGTGPGPGYLTGRGRALMEEGDVFVGGASALAVAPAWGEKIPVAGSFESVLDRVEEYRADGRDVCVLTSGDPGFYSLLSALEERFPREALVEPGISSVQLLAARIGLPWQEMVHVSVHGRGPGEELALGLRRAGTEVPVSVLCDQDFGPAEVAKHLLTEGWIGQGVVGSRLGRADEVVEVLTFEKIVPKTWHSPAVFLALPEHWVRARDSKPVVLRRPDQDDVRLSPTLSPGDDAACYGEASILPDEAFRRGEGIPLSRWEIRAVLLAVAVPRARRVIWDVGAGSGGFSVELARANPQARVVAFERNSEACRWIQENAKRFRARVEVVQGRAPLAFGETGNRETAHSEGAHGVPDLVVVGGSGGRLEETVKEVEARIAPGGRIIVTAVTLQTVGVGEEQLSGPAWTGFQATQLSSAHWERTGIMRGANPVTLLWADRKEEW